ncbi:hypothetical protein AB0J94_10025 [Micromonospora noduli]|uniref:Uncharacterized protein n=1 Tax=Micromonospora noduli TaxID=709876 RepID=A0A328NAW6_9ACTN|nr:hypothetical protein [Micromonospora noduli]KAB1922132.1 hypothetical protein F8280_20175 [Micromonospora noduli]RAO01517.1 hypothetical protein LAH08_02840 [Micromonospora noduli]RAO09491.1 hypothetical protein MED15_05779 [Micromonospora noduli]RAO13002.1 hypothetical protein LUPAC07_04494 [Micromonospora noduli]RAO18931.1 hypothetical protein GUI43_00604 [Micromonospora noduli]
MNEQELREGLRSEMAETTPPPPLSTTAALDAARRRHFRRRALWASLGSAAVVLAVTGFAAVATPDGHVYQPAGQGPLASPDTKEPWPTGPDGQPQEDRTARAGSRYEQGAHLLTEAVSVIPSGYTTPEDPSGRSAEERTLRTHQAQFEAKVDGVDVWSYSSSVAVAQGKGTGRVIVEVHDAGNQLPTEPCDLAQKFWGMRGECQVETVGAVRVGVVVRPSGDDRLDQWSAYRHPDGVVVFVAQGVRLDESRPALTKLPFSVPQLAALAVDERFHLK